MDRASSNDVLALSGISAGPSPLQQLQQLQLLQLQRSRFASVSPPQTPLLLSQTRVCLAVKQESSDCAALLLRLRCRLERSHLRAASDALTLTLQPSVLAGTQQNRQRSSAHTATAAATPTAAAQRRSGLAHLRAASDALTLTRKHSVLAALVLSCHCSVRPSSLPAARCDNRPRLSRVVAPLASRRLRSRLLAVPSRSPAASSLVARRSARLRLDRRSHVAP